MRWIPFFFVLWVGLIAQPLIGAGADSALLSVAADSTLRDALKELTEAWANSHNGSQPIELEFANDRTLRNGVEKGEAWDVVIFANGDTVKTLTASGSLQAAGQTALAKNELVVLGHKPLIADEEPEWYNLIDQEWERVAIGDPDKVASGHYAVVAMQKRGVDKKLKSAPILGEDDRDVLGNAQRNEVDAVFLFQTSLPQQPVPGYDIFKIETIDCPPVIYIAAFPKTSHQPAAAAEFVAFLQGKIGREIWKRWKFVIDN